jgi:hypothetical protein
MNPWHVKVLTLDRLSEPEPPPDLHDLAPADLFDLWLFAAVDCSLALREWMSADWDEKADAHAAYCAALDREQHAAGVLARRARAC